MDRSLDELWFVNEIADKLDFGDDPRNIFAKFNAHRSTLQYNEAFYKCLRLAKHVGKTALLLGTPGNEKYDSSGCTLVGFVNSGRDVSKGTDLSWLFGVGKDRIDKACNVARSARFEHGEIPD